MAGLDDLRGLLAGAQASVDDARTHLALAGDLLGQARQALVNAQGDPRPWLPPQLPWLIDELEAHGARLDGVNATLRLYEARL